MYNYELSINNKNGDFMLLLIFILKIIENCLNTIRIILVSNNKKVLGALLLGITSLLWIISASIVIINNSILKIISFVIGSVIGSYLGSLIEEKIALGTSLITVIIDNKYTDIIKNKLNYKISIIKNDKEDILLIIVPRKKRNNLVNIIKKINNNATIISERIYHING